jgi:hypothetical protein
MMPAVDEMPMVAPDTSEKAPVPVQLAEPEDSKLMVPPEFTVKVPDPMTKPLLTVKVEPEFTLAFPSVQMPVPDPVICWEEPVKNNVAALVKVSDPLSICIFSVILVVVLPNEMLPEVPLNV